MSTIWKSSIRRSSTDEMRKEIEVSEKEMIKDYYDKIHINIMNSSLYDYDGYYYSSHYDDDDDDNNPYNRWIVLQSKLHTKI